MSIEYILCNPFFCRDKITHAYLQYAYGNSSSSIGSTEAAMAAVSYLLGTAMAAQRVGRIGRAPTCTRFAPI